MTLTRALGCGSAILFVMGLGACVGGMTEDPGESVGPTAKAGKTPGDNKAPGGSAGPAAGPGADPTTGAAGDNLRPGSIPPRTLAWPVEWRGTPSPLRRLSRDEIVASVTMLIGMAPARIELPDEPRIGHGPLLTSGLSFIAPEVNKIKQVMADFAVRAAPSVLMRSACALKDRAQQDCLLAFVTKIVESAWRRSPRPEEMARFQKLLTFAGTTREGDLLAVEGVVTALFISPSFLYRSEKGAAVAGRPGFVALNGYEIATRISYLATLAAPDTDLLVAAKNGSLANGAERVRHFDRLIKTDLGKRALAVFVLEWMGAGESKVSQKSSRYLAGLSADAESALRASAEAAIRKVLSDSPDPTLSALLTTDGYLADPALQKIRAAAGTGKTASADPDATTRVGLLMHPHVLASHTKEDGASPFQMGLFLREGVLCQTMPPPPMGAAASARTDVPAGLTVREDLEFRTNVGGVCQGCHQQFAPLGFAFLPFDPVGRWVTKDPSGKPWDLSGSVETFAAGPLAFKSATDLVKSLAQSPQVRGCFTQGAVQWALGRALVKEDQDLLLVADEAERKSQGSVPNLFQAIVASPHFVNAPAQAR